MNTPSDWFENWFDSPFYHILYKGRNCMEAEDFIDNLIDFLKPTKNASFIDVGCGKGRHAIFLSKKGFNVTGIDLSSNSIAEANKSSNAQLHFYVHDMRKQFRINQFDYVLNLFTSFGYFEGEEDNQAAIKSMADNLKSNGKLILDFMNSKKIIENIIPNEIKIVDGIEFNITKKVENNFIIKTIHFFYNEKNYSFQEKVKALTLIDFKKYLEANQLKIVHLLGDYKLNLFDEKKSERLILIAEKE